MQTLTPSETTCSLLSVSEISTISSVKNPDSSLTILQFDNQTADRVVSDQITNITPLPQLISWEYAAYTDTGRQRNHNEDYFAIDSKVHKQELPEGVTLTGTGLYILCDGMGGHAGGEVASKLAVNTIRRYFQETWTNEELPNREGIEEAVYLANQAIYDLHQQQSRS
ncbi:MAG: serine/threonine protein phosphatase, partial [Dolichospermum sp.]